MKEQQTQERDVQGCDYSTGAHEEQSVPSLGRGRCFESVQVSLNDFSDAAANLALQSLCRGGLQALRFKLAAM